MKAQYDEQDAAPAQELSDPVPRLTRRLAANTMSLDRSRMKRGGSHADRASGPLQVSGEAVQGQRARDGQAEGQNIEGETSARHRRTAEANRGDQYALAVGGDCMASTPTKQKDQYESDEPARGRPLLLFSALGLSLFWLGPFSPSLGLGRFGLGLSRGHWLGPVPRDQLGLFTHARLARAGAGTAAQYTRYVTCSVSSSNILDSGAFSEFC